MSRFGKENGGMLDEWEGYFIWNIDNKWKYGKRGDW